MAKLALHAGSTSETVDVFIQDSTKTDGSGLTGLAYNSVGLTCYYNFPRGASTAVTLATLASATAAWSSGGFKEIDATNQKGKYRFDIPSTLLASGNGRYVGITFQGATGMAPVLLEIELTGWDNQNSVNGGMTALPAVASGSAGAIPTTGTGANQISVSSGQVILQAGTGTGQLDFTSGIVKSNLSQVLGGTCPATSVTGVPKVDVQDIAGAAVSTSSAQIGVNAVQIGGAVPGSATVGTVTNLTNAPTSGDFTSTMKTSLNAATVTVGTNNDKTGYSLSALESPIVDSGTAQAGGASTITLRAGASAVDNFYRGLMIRIYGGVGAGQARVITAYIGSGTIPNTCMATVDNAWAVNPDNTSTYAIVGHESPQLDATGSVKIQIPLKRNTAQPVFPFTMRDTNGNLVSGLTVAAQITIDGAAFAPSTNAPTQLGGGWYLLNLAAADLNGTAIGLRFTAAGAVPKDIQIFTQP